MTEETFYAERALNIAKMISDSTVSDKSMAWMNSISKYRYAYNFDWLGRPAIQFPNDAWALQEIVWETRPTIIIETGIAHGGSLLISASLLALLDLCDFLQNKSSKFSISRKVIGIDIDIRLDNRAKLDSHPLACYLELVEGSSVEESTFNRVRKLCGEDSRIMVLLDSNHTADHVFRELEMYSKLVSGGMYLIVYDTALELQEDSTTQGRPWGRGNGPLTAVNKFLAKSQGEFVQDLELSGKLAISVAPFGFLKKVAIE